MAAPRALLAAIGAALLVAGCGGGGSSGGSGSIPDTADFAPASSAFFVSVNTDFNGEQWQKASAIVNRFPSRDEFLKELQADLAKDNISFERDLKPLLGPEVGIAGFDISSDDPPYVVFTKSPDPAKLAALVKKGSDPGVSREIDGWTVVSDEQKYIDRFVKERAAGDTLADDDTFKGAIGSVDTDGAAVAYVAGKGVQNAITEGAASSGAPPEFTKAFGSFRSFVLSAAVQDEGVGFDEATTLADDLGLNTYDPKLDESVPGKPIFFLSAENIDKLARYALDVANRTVPGFPQQRQQIETALGFSIDKDIIPLLAGEVAIAVYGEPGGGLPVTVDELHKVDDEANAKRVMDRIGALLELGQTGTATKVQVAGKQATQLTFPDGGFSIFWVVTDGKLEISTSRAGLETLLGGGPRLIDDSAYRAALKAAGTPHEVSALVYSDLTTAVPFFIEQSDTPVDAKTRANLKPLKSVVASMTPDGKTLHISGLVGIG